jgi:glycine cleavage system regulatory protein
MKLQTITNVLSSRIAQLETDKAMLIAENEMLHERIKHLEESLQQYDKEKNKSNKDLE